MAEQRELIEQLRLCKKEITELKKKLNELNELKEGLFRKKEEYNREISRIIGQVKDSRGKRNEFTKEVKLTKSERDELNELLRKKIEEAKKLNKEKRDIQQKYGIKDDPSVLSKRIEHLEHIIETEAISFEKEKGLMKEINTLKKKFKEAAKISNVWKQMQQVSKEIDELREKVGEKHSEVQLKARESQKKHEDLIEGSKELDELRQKEEEAFRNFKEAKKNFNEISSKLQEKLMEAGKLSEELDKMRGVKHESRQKDIKARLKEKGAAVHEKLRKGEKLTTEDILVMQEMEK